MMLILYIDNRLDEKKLPYKKKTSDGHTIIFEQEVYGKNFWAEEFHAESFSTIHINNAKNVDCGLTQQFYMGLENLTNLFADQPKAKGFEWEDFAHPLSVCLIEKTNPSLVILHLNAGKVGGNYFSEKFAMLCINKNIPVLAISGGNKENDKATWLPANIDLIHFSPGDENFWNKLNIDKFLAQLFSKSKFKKRHWEILLGKTESLHSVRSLLILLESYLAIRNPNVVFGDLDCPQKIKQSMVRGTVISDSAKTLTQFTSAENNELFPIFNVLDPELISDNQLDKVDDACLFSPCLADISKTPFLDLARENPSLRNCISLGVIWQLLRGECLNKTDGSKLSDASYTQDSLTLLFTKAYIELQEIFVIKNIKQFELERHRLNHNIIKNNLVGAILNGDVNTKYKDRISKINDAFTYITDGDETNKNAHDSLMLDFARWPSIREKISDFLETRPKSYGLEYTPFGIKAIQEITKIGSGYISNITDFIDTFQEISSCSDLEKEERIKKFFDSLTKIAKTFDSMKDKENEYRFGGFLASKNQGYRSNPCERNMNR